MNALHLFFSSSKSRYKLLLFLVFFSKISLNYSGVISRKSLYCEKSCQIQGKSGGTYMRNGTMPNQRASCLCNCKAPTRNGYLCSPFTYSNFGSKICKNFCQENSFFNYSGGFCQSNSNSKDFNRKCICHCSTEQPYDKEKIWDWNSDYYNFKKISNNINFNERNTNKQNSINQDSHANNYFQTQTHHNNNNENIKNKNETIKFKTTTTKEHTTQINPSTTTTFFINTRPSEDVVPTQGIPSIFNSPPSPPPIDDGNLTPISFTITKAVSPIISSAMTVSKTPPKTRVTKTTTTKNEKVKNKEEAKIDESSTVTVTSISGQTEKIFTTTSEIPFLLTEYGDTHLLIITSISIPTTPHATTVETIETKKSSTKKISIKTIRIANNPTVTTKVALITYPNDIRDNIIEINMIVTSTPKTLVLTTTKTTIIEDENSIKKSEDEKETINQGVLHSTPVISNSGVQSFVFNSK